MAEIKYAVVTHTGNVRDHNEDSYFADAQQKLWLVADGMGGHAGGEIASALAVEIISQRVAMGDDLATAIEHAHHGILAAVRDGRGKYGMGTTVVALRLHDNEYEIAWIGDSRIYHWDGERLSQLSKDQSYVQLLVDLGKILPDEMRFHPQKNIITQNLGADQLEHMMVDVHRGPLKAGEKILLCSDGLSDELVEARIARVFEFLSDERAITEELLAATLEGHASDNVTAIVVSTAS